MRADRAEASAPRHRRRATIVGRGRRTCRAGLIAAAVAVIASCGGGAESGTQPGADLRTLSLNGPWDLAEGALDDAPPSIFAHVVPVPGFADMADPPLAEVGVPSSRRAAFWYRRAFEVPADAGPVAILRLHKVKYGAKAWLNGIEIGSHLGAFTLFEADVSNAVMRGRTNVLVVRVGADKGQVPPEIPTGEDIEKYLWLPGIWDDVTLTFSDRQRIARVKIEPEIERDRVVVHTTLVNHAAEPVDVEIGQVVVDEGGDEISRSSSRLRIPVGESSVTQTVAVPAARWWSPEDPVLYALSSRVDAGGRPADERSTRFGMRSVEWRGGAEPGFFLNGERYYLRGSNLSLHRFFQSTQRGGLPWDRAWVRRLLGTHPKAMHWNSMRVSIGRLPNFWYDLADEVGILLADEFMMWSLARESTRWSVDEMEKEYRLWIEENWNHPSIGWWDASNETLDEKSTIVVERLRGLDPTRQWENGGHNPPQGSDDPVEDHPYILFGLGRLADLPLYDFTPPVAPSTAVAPGHAYIANEYNLLWLQRDGLPFPSIAAAFERVPGMIGGFSPAEYREASAYVGSVLTEFWRSQRGYAGVQYFTYITESPLTGDAFLDVRDLILDPRWQRYAADAFAPFSVNLHFWEEEVDAAAIDVAIVLINDTLEPQAGQLELLAVAPDGSVLERSPAVTVDVARLGKHETVVRLPVPSVRRWVLFARLEPANGDLPTVWSRRKIGYRHLGEPIPDPPFDGVF
jgi:beta-galactosidase